MLSRLGVGFQRILPDPIRCLILRARSNWLGSLSGWKLRSIGLRIGADRLEFFVGQYQHRIQGDAELLWRK
jgi:hypothetical protein